MTLAWFPFSNHLAQTIDELFNDDEDFQSVLVFNTRITNQEINNALSEFQVERGAECGVVHAHRIIQEEHKSILMLGYKKFQEHLYREFSNACKKQQLPVPKGMFLHAKPLKELAASLTDKKRIIDYINKNKKGIDNSDNVAYSGKDWHKQNEHVKSKV